MADLIDGIDTDRERFRLVVKNVKSPEAKKNVSSKKIAKHRRKIAEEQIKLRT